MQGAAAPPVFRRLRSDCFVPPVKLKLAEMRRKRLNKPENRWCVAIAMDLLWGAGPWIAGTCLVAWALWTIHERVDEAQRQGGADEPDRLVGRPRRVEEQLGGRGGEAGGPGARPRDVDARHQVVKPHARRHLEEARRHARATPRCTASALVRVAHEPTASAGGDKKTTRPHEDVQRHGAVGRQQRR